MHLLGAGLSRRRQGTKQAPVPPAKGASTRASSAGQQSGAAVLLGIHPKRGETFRGIGNFVLRGDDLKLVAPRLERGPDHGVHRGKRVFQRGSHGVAQ
jgi:hypothetical protein